MEKVCKRYANAMQTVAQKSQQHSYNIAATYRQHKHPDLAITFDFWKTLISIPEISLNPSNKTVKNLLKAADTITSDRNRSASCCYVYNAFKRIVMKRTIHPKRVNTYAEKLELCNDYKLEAWVLGYFEIDQKTIHGWFRKGLPVYFITRKLKYYRESELDEFFQKHKIVFTDSNKN